jgi:hypothetical protein
MGLNRLMANMADAAKRGTVRVFERVEQLFDETSNEELSRRVQLRDATFRMAGSGEFKQFHADAIARGPKEALEGIEGDIRKLLDMPTAEFKGENGVELRGIILGQEKVFKRITEIIADGNRAEKTLEQRRTEREKRFRQGAHTNVTAT